MAAAQSTQDRFAFTDHAGARWLVMAADGPCFGPMGVADVDRFEVLGEDSAQDFAAWLCAGWRDVRAVNVSQGPPCERIRRSELEAFMEREQKDPPRLDLVEHMRELFDLGHLDTPGRLRAALGSERFQRELGGEA